MRFPWTEVIATVGAVAGPARGAAQQVREVGIEAVATSSEPALVVAGPYGAIRTSTRTRVSAALGAGLSDGDFAWRGEALVHFLLNPARRRGWGAYFTGGLAADGGPVSRGYMVLALGIEERPGGPSGWVAEAGVGGGLRVMAGYRWRRFSSGWPQ
jgi:hypothetical protein